MEVLTFGRLVQQHIYRFIQKPCSRSEVAVDQSGRRHNKHGKADILRVENVYERLCENEERSE
jgi:hypothetical protein